MKKKTIARKFLISVFLSAMLPALLAMFALLYLLSAHDAMVMGHLRSINRDRTPIIESYKNLITDKKHGFVAVASLMGENLQYAALSEQPPKERARTLFAKNKEIARIAFYPRGSFEELGTDTSYETPPLPPSFLKERKELLGGKYRYVSHTRAIEGGELQIILATPGTPMTHYKKLASQYQENLKVIRIFKGIRKYYWYFFFLLLAIIVGISSTLSILILNNVAKRIKHLALATKSVASGDLDTAVSTEGNDELAELADDFNNMVRDLKETRNKIIYLERMGAWQEVARNLAHEIKNPLTPILLAVQQIEEKAPRNDPAFTGMVRTAAGIVKEEVHTLRRLVDTFGNLARLPDKKEAPIEVIPFLDEFYDLVRLTWKETRLTCDGILPKGTTITGDRMLLKRALINVVENAIHAMEGGQGESALTISVTIERERLSIAVLDTGPGIAQVDKIFNPYFTTKEQGTGLGLPLARKIILDMGGDLSAANRTAGTGAVFTTTLPLAKNK